MVFSSMEFIFRFVPVFFVIYFLTKPKYRNLVLLIGSLIFYACGEPIFVLLLIFSVIVNHLFARRIGWREDRQRNGDEVQTSRHWLVLALIYNFGVLFLFKYMNFFIDICNQLAGNDWIPEVSLPLPLGISFYTFQMTSYLIDVYRNAFEPERNILYFATYAVMFPQLTSGPIVNYREVREALHKREVDLRGIEWGVTIFIMGLTYKILLADKIASLWNEVQTAGAYGINTPTAWLGSWGYSMQIFFDFFGYSLMAIGLGRIMGFNLPVNFNNPYCVKSATEFWRKWHITLGRWFREYVYIPLGGNRKGTARLLLNIFVVWLLTGLWHGANWNFLLWGLLFAVLLTLEKVWLLPYLQRSRVLGHLYMLFWIPVSWTIFNISDLAALQAYLSRMFGIPLAGSAVYHGMAKFAELLGTYGWLLALCVLGCTPWPLRWIRKYYRTWPCKLLLFVLFWICIYQIANGSNNPFLYFRF